MLHALTNPGPAVVFGMLPFLVIMANADGAEISSVSSAEALLTLDRPVVIGHRGYNKFAPENTLPSFKLAKAAGADLVELDYHHTQDGVPVVIHDPELDRTTDAVERWKGSKIRVDSRTLGELQTLDAGKWFDAGFAGTRLSTLAEALDFIQDGGMTLIERKAGDPGTCIQLLQERDLINKVVVQSFDWNYLREFHQAEPRQVLGALGPPWSWEGKKLEDSEKELDASWVRRVGEAGARIVVWNSQVTPESIAYAHQLGLKVWVYTIDEPVPANELLDKGVDGLISNNVSMMWRTVALRSVRRAPAPGLATTSPPAANPDSKRGNE